MPEEFNPFHKKEPRPGDDGQQQPPSEEQAQEGQTKQTPEQSGSGWTSTSKDRTGGEHGSVYTKPFALQETGRDAFNEISNTFTEGKNPEKPSQKTCRQLLEQLRDIGFSFDMLSSTEARHLPEDIRSALETLSQVDLTSLASTSRFTTSAEYKTLVTAAGRGLSSKTKQILRQIFGETITFEKATRTTFESQGLMSNSEMEKMRREIKNSRNELSYIDFKPRSEDEAGFRNFIRHLTNMSRGNFQTKEISDGPVRETLVQSIGEAVDSLALRLSYYRAMLNEKTQGKASGLDSAAVEKTLSDLQHVYSLLLPLLQGKEGADTLSDKNLMEIFTDKVLPALKKAQTDIERLENTENKNR